MEHVYYGCEFSDKEIEKDLDRCSIKYEKMQNVESFTAEKIKEGNIIGWFQGRMEGGSRALGNRSILADPTNPKMKNIVNAKVKFRESWRPFCPSIIDKYRTEYFDIDHDSPFMILAFNVLKNKQNEIPSVVHVDGTARPQTVKKSINKKYHKLIECFMKETGVPVLLNTSFNIKGEPIVCKPLDAIRTFYGSGLDYLIIGNYVISKMNM